jgi:hypothetical protein
LVTGNDPDEFAELVARVDHLEALLWSLVEARWSGVVATVTDLAFVDSVIDNLTPASRRARVRRMFFGRMDATAYSPMPKDRLLATLADAINAADGHTGDAEPVPTQPYPFHEDGDA